MWSRKWRLRRGGPAPPSGSCRATIRTHSRPRPSPANPPFPSPPAPRGFAFPLRVWVAPWRTAALVPQPLALAVRRRREYLADAMSAQFTRNPLALASALGKIEDAGAPTLAIKRGAAHLCIVDPLGRRFTNREGWLADTLATHPPMSMRITRLKGMGYAQLKEEGGSFTSSARG